MTTRKEGETLEESILTKEGQKSHKQIRCKKCGRIYLLPIKASSWRCQNKNCQKFNDLNPDICIIL